MKSYIFGIVPCSSSKINRRFRKHVTFIFMFEKEVESRTKRVAAANCLRHSSPKHRSKCNELEGVISREIKFYIPKILRKKFCSENLKTGSYLGDLDENWRRVLRILKERGYEGVTGPIRFRLRF